MIKFLSTKSKKSINVVLAMLILFSTVTVEAASLVIEPVTQDVRAQDVFVVTVAADTAGQEINAVDGQLVIGDGVTSNFEVRDISVAGSGFSIWPRKPSLSSDGSVISFTGGVPAPVKGVVPLFKVVVFARNPGELRIQPRDITMYAADGKGTALIVNAQDRILSVGLPGSEPKDGWHEVIATDNSAPQPFDITLHQDSSLYDGQKFLSFPAIDQESGIAYYEVVEGGTLPVRSGDQYVLVNQDRLERVVVTAFDAAGNTRVGIFTGKTKVNWLAIIFWTIVLFIISRRKNIMKLIKRKRNRAKVF